MQQPSAAFEYKRINLPCAAVSMQAGELGNAAQENQQTNR
jgi:hypothetical protein